MQRNLFETFQLKVQTLLKDSEEAIHIEDLENLEVYIKTAELMLKDSQNTLPLHNFIIALMMKKISEQQKKNIEGLETSKSSNSLNKLEIESKPKEIKHQNMTLKFVKQINELHRQNKELKDKNFKINEEIKEYKNILQEKNKEIEGTKKQIELANQNIEDLQKQIQELATKKQDDVKENDYIDKKEIEKIINKHKAAKSFRSLSFSRTINKLDNLLNQDKMNLYVSKNAIRNCMGSTERTKFFQNPPVDRSKISDTEKLICELADTCSKKMT